MKLNRAIFFLILFLSFNLYSQTYLEKKEFGKLMKLYNQRKYKEAYKGFKRFYSKFPSSYYLPEIYYYIGKLGEDYYTSVLIFKELVLKFPDYKKADEVFYRMGKLYFFHNNYTEAIRVFEQLLKKYKKSNYLYGAKYWTGLCNLMLGKNQRAFEYFESVLKYEKKDRFYYLAVIGKANVFFEGNKHWDAVKLLKQEIKHGVDKNFIPSFYLGIAKNYLKIKKYDKAYYYYKLILKNYSGTPEYEIAIKQMKYMKDKKTIFNQIFVPSENPNYKNKAVKPYYTIQVSSVKNKRIANDWRVKLKVQGYSTFMESVKIKNSKYYRTYVGKYKTKKQAQIVRGKLKMKYKLDCIVVKKERGWER